MAECRDPRMAPAESMRFYLNSLVAGAGKWMDPGLWDAAYDPEFQPKQGMSIALGFDGSKTWDATALVATCMTTGTQWVAGLWERNWLMEDWTVPVEEVLARVDEILRGVRGRTVLLRPAVLGRAGCDLVRALGRGCLGLVDGRPQPSARCPLPARMAAGNRGSRV